MKPSVVASLAISLVVLRFSFGLELNSSFLCDIIRKLNSYYQIDTLPIFRTNSFADDFPSFTNLFQQLQKETSLPQMHFIEFSTEEIRFITNRDFTLSIVLTRQGSLEVLKSAAKRLNRMHASKMLIVLRDPVVLKDLKYLLNWLWRENFFEVLVIFKDRIKNQNRIFTIDPFPRIQWLNRTELTSTGKFFLEQKKDLKQYRIETPFTEDVPRVFVYTSNGKRHIVGRNANIIIIFAAHMNIKLVCKYKPDLDLKMVLKQLPNTNSELSLHSYPMFYLDGFEWSYPLDMVYFCIMVPHRGVPKSEYIVIAFDYRTWLASAISVIFIAVVMRFIDPRKSQMQENAKTWYFFRSLAIIIYSPNMAERMTSPSIRQFLFFAQVFVLAFILSCFYSTYLTSFCTEKVFQRPIETIEDLAREHLRIMLIDYESITAQQYANFGDKFLQLLYPVPYFEAIRRRDNFDSKYAYSIQHDRWFYLDKQQRGLRHPVFRLSNICFGPHYLLFPLQQNSFLQPYLFEFFLRVTSAGLDQYWEEEAFRLAVTMKHSKVLVDQTVFVQPLGWEYFQYAFVGWFVGIIISTMSFVDEVLR